MRPRSRRKSAPHQVVKQPTVTRNVSPASSVTSNPNEVEGEVLNEVQPVNEDEENRQPDAAELGPRKKPRLHIRLTENEEDELAEFVASNPCLYNKKLRDWTNRAGKDRLWQDQAEKMNKSVCDIKTWYDSIRTRIGRLRKTKSGQGETVFTERNRWIFSRFEFLCPHIVEVKRRTAVSMKEKVAPVVTLSSPDDAEPYDDATQEGLPGISDESGSATPQTTDIQLPSISATASHSTPKTRSTRAAVDQELMSSLTSSYKKQDQILQLSQQLLTQIKPPSADRERTNFSDWVASILHQLPYDLYKTAQRQIWTTLQHVRDEQDRREGNQASQSQQMQQPKQQQQQQQTMHNQGNQGGWQPPPNLWPQQIQGPQVSVWDSQNAVWVQQQVPGQQICQQGSPQSAQPPSASNQMPATSSASKQMPTTSGAPSSTPSDSLNLSQQSVFNLSSVTRFLADEGLQELE